MRKLFTILAATGLVISVASSAGAGTLTGATLSIVVPGGLHATAAVFQASAAGTGQSSATSATFGAGSALAGSEKFLSGTDLEALQVFIHGNGKVSASNGGAVSITGPIVGTAGAAVSISGGGPLVIVPLRLGSVSSQTVTAFGGQLRATVSGSAWHLGKVSQTGFFTSRGVDQVAGTVISTTVGGKHRIRVQTTGSFDLTANGAGTVKLVTLTHLVSSGVAVTDAWAPTSLTLTYAAPEPGTLLLIGAGILGLIAAGRRKQA